MPVVIGENARIDPGAKTGPYSAIVDNFVFCARPSSGGASSPTGRTWGRGATIASDVKVYTHKTDTHKTVESGARGDETGELIDPGLVAGRVFSRFVVGAFVREGFANANVVGDGPGRTPRSASTGWPASCPPPGHHSAPW